MIHQVYINSIFELIVKPWLKAGGKFVFKDGNSGYSTEQANPVHKQKENHGLKSYFNYAQSPDLLPIDNY